MVNALFKLKYLRLHMNGFFGQFHKEIAGLVSLTELHAFGNYFAGTLPKELGSLSNLEVIDVYANQLTGRVPSELGRLTKLRYLDVHDNNCKWLPSTSVDTFLLVLITSLAWWLRRSQWSVLCPRKSAHSSSMN
jgi:Leucine-rich repeat (LRR) protein